MKSKNEEVCTVYEKEDADRIVVAHNAPLMEEVEATLEIMNKHYGCGYPLKPCCCENRLASAVKALLDKIRTADENSQT